MVKSILCLLLLASSPFFASAQREERGIGCLMAFDGFLNLCSDSLNFISSPKDLPNFLDDHLFDWRMRDNFLDCGCDREDGFSARVAILDRVINEKALRWIVESKNGNYDKLYNPEEEEKQHEPTYDTTYPILPFMKDSIRKLAEKRLKEIEKVKRQMKR